MPNIGTCLHIEQTIASSLFGHSNLPPSKLIMSLCPWQWIVLICGPGISIPSLLSNEIPDEVIEKGNDKGGEMGDFATFMNLCPDLASSTRRMVTA